MAIVVINIKSALCARHKSAGRERERALNEQLKWRKINHKWNREYNLYMYIFYFGVFFACASWLARAILRIRHVAANNVQRPMPASFNILFRSRTLTHTHTHVCHFLAVQYFIIILSALHLLQGCLSIGHGQVDRPIRDIWIIKTTVRTMKILQSMVLHVLN